MHHSRAVLVCLLLALGTAGCVGADRPELAQLVAPALDQVEPAVREDLERALADLEAVAATPGVSDETLGAAYGELGRLYHAYEIYDSALPCYRNARALLPDDPRWPYYLGRIYIVLEEPEQARTALERVIELEPHDEPARVALAEIHRDAGNSEEARRCAEEVLARNGSSAAAMLLMAELATDRAEFAEAVEWYEALLRIQPGATALHHPLGLAYRNLGRLEKAERFLQARGDEPLQTHDPLMDGLSALQSGSKAQMNRGTAAFKAGQFDLAEPSFRNAIEIDPDDTGARLNLGSTLVRLGRVDEAIEQYREVLARDPEHAKAHFNLGVALGRQGATEESTGHYEEALRIDPDYVNPRFNLANNLRRKGACDEALGHYRRLLKTNPGQGPVRAGEASCLIQDGRFREARLTLEDGLQLLPDSRILRLTTARLLAACPDEGIRDGLRALGLAERLVEEGRTPISLEALAMALAEAGRFDEALRVQQEAIELAERGGSPALHERLTANLGLYERNRPCRNPLVE